jgi:hypothetical protein
MEDFEFDVNSILSPEEAEALFSEETQEEQEQVEEPAEKKVTQTEEVEEPSEGVGQEDEIDETEEDAVEQTSDGSSPTKFYSSIAKALKDDGIFPDFTDDELNAVESPEDFAELIEKAVTARQDERTRRIDEALGNGANPDQVKMYEQTLSYLSTITEDALNDEGEDGENLRKQLIYNDLINRGYSQEKAAREVEKSFKSGSDIDDAKDALEALNKFYQAGYTKLQNDAKAQAEAARNARKEDAEKFRKMVLEDDVVIGETKLDKRTRQKVFDAVSKPVYKDPDTGQLLTQVQKFQKENPLEFLKQLGMWFVLTNGGKSADGLIKEQLRVEKNKGIRELEGKINSTSFNKDGSLRYVSGTQQTSDTLLSDDWQVDMGSRE